MPSDKYFKVRMDSISNFTKMTPEILQTSSLEIQENTGKNLIDLLGAIEISEVSLVSEASKTDDSGSVEMFIRLSPPGGLCPTCKRKL